MSCMEQLEQLREWVNESKNIVFFGGAGVSTESGIPDFRSVDGRMNFIAFTVLRCCVLTRNLTRHI